MIAARILTHVAARMSRLFPIAFSRPDYRMAIFGALPLNVVAIDAARINTAACVAKGREGRKLRAKSNPAAKSSTPSGRMLTELEASEFLKISRRTLQAWRLKGGGPKFCSFGRAVRYCETDISQWIEGCKRASTSQNV